MIGTLKKIFAFAGGRKNLLKKSLFFSLLNGIFASFQFGALYFIVDALASDDHSFTSVWMSLGMMALSIAGRIFASFFSMNEQTIVGYGMVADKRISIGDRLRYIPMGYFNKNNIGTITGIVTTTLGDVESAAPVALVNMIGSRACTSLQIRLRIISSLAVRTLPMSKWLKLQKRLAVMTLFAPCRMGMTP